MRTRETVPVTTMRHNPLTQTRQATDRDDTDIGIENGTERDTESDITENIGVSEVLA